MISTKLLYTWKSQFLKPPHVRAEVLDQAAEIKRLKRERHERPIAAFHRLFKFLQCGTSLRPFVYRAAFCRLKRRSADLAVIDPFPLIAGSGALRQPKRRTLLHFAIHNLHLGCCSLASGKALTLGDIFKGNMSMVRSRAKLRVQPECQLQLVAIFDTTFWTSNAS
jgi:hypothetical protein